MSNSNAKRQHQILEQRCFNVPKPMLKLSTSCSWLQIGHRQNVSCSHIQYEVGLNDGVHGWSDFISILLLDLYMVRALLGLTMSDSRIIKTHFWHSSVDWKLEVMHSQPLDSGSTVLRSSACFYVMVFHCFDILSVSGCAFIFLALLSVLLLLI